MKVFLLYSYRALILSVLFEFIYVQLTIQMMGIYTDSPSIVSVVVKNMDEKAKVNSQLRVIAREMYLHPSPWGAHVVHAILSNPKLYTAW